jgi:hypothetical protein
MERLRLGSVLSESHIESWGGRRRRGERGRRNERTVDERNEIKE